jgi:hypothetical protein
MMVFACAIGVILIIKWCYTLSDNHGLEAKASGDLEEFMKYNHVNSVRALLEVRGHLLKRDVINNTKIWLAEK